MATGSVAGFNVAPVKSLGLEHPTEILLDEVGVCENRRFFVVQEDGRLFRGAYHGPLVRIRPEYDPSSERLTLHFPDGAAVGADALGGEPTTGDFWGRPVPGRVLESALCDALSDYACKPLRILRAAEDGIGGDSLHPVSLVGDGSVAELGRRLGDPALDPRRFRMLVELSGLEPHAEDEWEGGLLRLGEAIVRVGGPVGRCANTTYDPETGRRDHDTLRAIKEYRGLIDGGVCFGVYADVVEPGRVRVGDDVIPVA
ncbi:MAG: MOSC domain-containing protein [Actinobacteria bacterium]|nr:MOSC domain-containing protein [Actinomycetota bacterium]